MMKEYHEGDEFFTEQNGTFRTYVVTAGKPAVKNVEHTGLECSQGREHKGNCNPVCAQCEQEIVSRKLRARRGWIHFDCRYDYAHALEREPSETP